MKQDSSSAGTVNSESPSPVREPGAELDLVDIWMALWRMRVFVLAVTIAVSAAGILLLSRQGDETQQLTVTSMLELVSPKKGTYRSVYVSPETLSKRIEYSLLPRFSTQSEFAKIAPAVLATRIVNPKYTSMLRIESRASPQTADLVAEFHRRLIGDIAASYEQSAIGHTRLELGDFVAKKINLMRLKMDLLAWESANPLTDAAVDSQARRIAAEIDGFKNEIAKIDSLLAELEALQAKKLPLGFRVAVDGRISAKTAPAPRPVTYALVVIFALFVALFGVIVILFSRRVADRMRIEES